MMLEDGIAGAVADQVGRILASGQRRGRPDLRRLLITQVEGLAWRIDHRIVAPGSQPILAAISRPSVARSRLGDQEAELWVGDDVDPGSRCPLTGFEVSNVLAPLGAETADAIVEPQIIGPGQGRRRLSLLLCAGGSEGRQAGGPPTYCDQLLGQRAFVAVQDGPGRRLQQHPSLSVHLTSV